MTVPFEIRVKGHLSQDWSEWLGEMRITQMPDGQTVLIGPLRDQAALFGVLIKIRDLGLVLVSVSQVESDQPLYFSKQYAATLARERLLGRLHYNQRRTERL